VKITNYYDTDPKWIVAESKRIFNIDICPTCSGQLIKAFQNLKTYYSNQEMAKKKEEKPIEEKSEFKLKKEFEGSTYSNGKISILLSELTHENAIKLLTDSEIKTYFE
jgi:hypothetical protein